MNRPLGVTLIGYFYMFGAAMLLVTAVLWQADASEIGLADRFGVSPFPEQLFRVIVAIAALIGVYGYMRLQKWGF